MNTLWNEMIWKRINDEIRKVAGTIRVAQKVFPTTILDNPDNIPADKFNFADFTIAEGLTKPFVEISASFSLTPNQVAYEPTLQTGLKLAKLRASDLARIEDLIFFRGTDAKASLPAYVKVRNLDSADKGLLGLATNNKPPNQPIPVPLFDPPEPGVLYGANTVNAVALGISLLSDKSQPGPFALFLDYRIVADAYSVLGGTFTTTADLITPIVTGGLFGTAALGPFTGLLVSLGGEPTTIYMGVDATTAFTEKNSEDNHFFRVFERVQFDARDPRAFVRLDFTPPPKPVVSKIDPIEGKALGGEPITITGESFARVSSIDFNGSLQPIFRVVDDTTITLKSPPHKAGKVDVRVTSPGGTSDINAGDKFTYK
jgi:hypothetical protein